METYASVDTRAKAPGFRKSVKFALTRLLGGSLEQLLFQWRRLSMRVNVWAGRPYTALYGMDRKLEKYLNFRGGTFIEAGANDGIAQSNSYFLENKYGWNGLLVEPVPKYYRMCRSARDAHVVNCGLGPFEKDGEELEILAGGLMSLPVSVDEKLLHGRSVRQHAAIGAREFGGTAPELVRTRVRALSNVLDELKITQVDFFSLDVEGFELEVLKGLDMSRHAPRYLLIETEQLAAVTEFLGARYTMIEALSHHDFLFRREGV
ncbi:MAG TPA: FkbM family methyltransferase [Steroidobacteraceae bacterium]|nr:FkbM family methyltransferase [Steroidobacteraceae bacterium]